MIEPKEFQYFFDADSLAEAGRRLNGSYVAADPFPHLVIDDFLPKSLLEELLVAANDPATNWQTKNVDMSFKSWCSDETEMHPSVQAMLFMLNSCAFLRFLEELSGVDGLIPDPYFEGGGLHRIERGGFLKIHADFNVHQKLGLDRRLNLLLYLNTDWQPDWGGALELWDAGMEKCVRSVRPNFGRMVIFSTTDHSFHGHPHPLRCPPDQFRMSLALYYYTVGRPESERSDSHSTLYQEMPGKASSVGSIRSWMRRMLGR